MPAEQCLGAKADGCGRIDLIDQNCAWTCADCTLAPTLAPTPAPTAPPIALNPELRTDAGQLILSTNEDLLINIYAVTGGGAAEASPGRQFALLEAMDTMAADISTLRDELSTEVRRVELDAQTQLVATADSIRSTAVDASTSTSRALSTIRTTAVSTSTAVASSLSTIRSTAVSAASTTTLGFSAANTQRAQMRAQLTAATTAQITANSNQLFTRMTAITSALSRTIAAVAARPQGKMIGHQQCEHRGANGANSRSTVVLTCTFRKLRTDTYWVIAHNADTRQINGHSEWRIEVDNQPCRDRGNSNRGSIDASYHGSGENMHRPMYVRGICYRTANQAPIRAGNHAVRWRQTYTSGDSYWGWNSNSRLMVEEWLP